jgi:hypothetical protein
MAPAQDWAWLKALVWRLERQGQSRRGKAGRMVSPHRLIELATSVMDGAEQESDPLKAAIPFRDGLVIALLAFPPTGSLSSRSLSGLPVARMGFFWGRRSFATSATGNSFDQAPRGASFTA